ncbi:hypothetical protein [Moorena producens]|uniref:hypothetical protein n=1 Tax=Moorena producens TaxID=1155739 RepID=UPI003C721B72
MSSWPDPTLTVDGKVGIGTETPSQELDVIGDISAKNLTLQGCLTIDKNLTVGGNFQLGTLSINTFSSDGNLADNSNLAVPTEQAVKTYVDNQISTRAALNGSASQDFATNNLTVGGNLRVWGNLEVQGDVIARDTEHIEGNVSLGDQDSDEVKITGVLRSGHSSGSLRIDDALHTTGSLTVDGSLSVSNAIATAQLRVRDRVTGSLTIENNLTVGGSLTTSQLNATGTIQANRFEGDGSSLEGIVKKTGDTITGSLTIANNLTVNGNIKTTGIISGSSLPPNLIRNSYMNILDGNKPAGYSTVGNVTIDAAHPYTKGFEGPYVAEKPSNAASSVDTATQANPYWFRRYYKGARASSGGLADGWRSLPDGRILKITGDNSADHTSVYFPFESNMLTNKVHFKAWLKITSGSKVGFGVVSGNGNRARGLIITKEQTDEAPDGWYQIDAVIDTPEVTYLDGWAFSMGIEARGSFEVYLALPYVANLDNDTWLPSVSDMLSRDGLTVHPSSRNVGIGTNSPEGKLDVRGDIRAGNSDIYFTNTNHNHTGIGNKSGWAAIENAANFGALMIMGRAGTSKGRYVRLWDYLQVNGGMDITGNVGIGTTNPTAKLVVTGGETSLQQENWQTPTLQNGWVNFGRPYNNAGYFKDSLGIVHLKGLVKNGTANTIFTLPAGYRPAARELHSVATYNNAMGRVDIAPDGRVERVTGSTLWISLDGITFRVG